jgi:hypothetical protein
MGQDSHGQDVGKKNHFRDKQPRQDPQGPMHLQLPSTRCQAMRKVPPSDALGIAQYPIALRTGPSRPTGGVVRRSYFHARSLSRAASNGAQNRRAARKNCVKIRGGAHPRGHFRGGKANQFAQVRRRRASDDSRVLREYSNADDSRNGAGTHRTKDRLPKA